MPALYRTYRPKTFAEIIGQDQVVRTLQNALKLDRIAHAYLLTGPRGTGKTTIARLLAKAANCTGHADSPEPCGKCDFCRSFDEGRALDIIEIDAATHTGVDNIRELRETVTTPPAVGRFRFYVIDEAHMLSTGAWNALLKTLEEPPAHAVFVLATTAPHKVPETIVSRCQRFDLSRFTVDRIVGKLARIAKEEHIVIENAALRMIALAAEGGMRDAESLLTQVATLQEVPITEADASLILGLTSHAKLEKFVGLIVSGDMAGAMSSIRELSDSGENLAAFSVSLLRYERAILLAAVDASATDRELTSYTVEQREVLLSFASRLDPKRVVRLIELFAAAAADIRTASIPELPLEIAVVKFLTPGPEPGAPVAAAMSKDVTPRKEREEPTVVDRKPKETVERSDDEPAKEKLTASGAPIALSDVRSKWNDIIREATRLNASLTLALTNARPVKAEGSTITIAVRFPFHKDRLAEPKARLTLKTAFDTILGTETHISVMVSDAPIEKETGADSSLIAQALSMLGGKVV